MRQTRLDMEIGVLESEERNLTRELNNTPKHEIMTIRGRMRRTVENRLRVCQFELKKLKQKKIDGAQ